MQVLGKSQDGTSQDGEAERPAALRMTERSQAHSRNAALTVIAEKIGLWPASTAYGWLERRFAPARFYTSQS